MGEGIGEQEMEELVREWALRKLGKYYIMQFQSAEAVEHNSHHQK